MATIQCKMCGGQVELPNGVTTGECPYCGRVTTFPNINTPQKEYLYTDELNELWGKTEGMDPSESLVPAKMQKHPVAIIEAPRMEEGSPQRETLYKMVRNEQQEQVDRLDPIALHQTKIKKKTGWERITYCMGFIFGFFFFIMGLILWSPIHDLLIIRSVRLAGNSGYWDPADPDERQARIDRILSILRVRPGETPMFSGRKEYDLAAMAAKLRTEIPELERAEIRRVLPDQLIFELHERLPVANLGALFYIDDSATVLDKSAYYDVSSALPSLSCKPASVRTSGDASPFKRGEVLTDSSIQTVLIFLRLARLEFTDIHPKHIYIAQDFIQCDLLYKNDPGAFTVLIPLRVREEQLRNDIFGRLLPKIESSVRNHEDERALDLRFKDRIIARKRG